MSVKDLPVCEKDYILNPVTSNHKNGKWMIQRLCVTKLQSHTMKKQSLFQQILMKKASCKVQNLNISLAFLLTTMALLIAVSFFCYLIKYRAKQKSYIYDELKQDLHW